MDMSYIRDKLTGTVYALKDAAARQMLAQKVDKVTGKGLSTNDFTTAYKNAVDANTTARHSHDNKSVLDGITSALVSAWSTASTWVSTNGANVLSHLSDTVKHITAAERTAWNGKSDFSGSYNDLSNKPTIPTKTSDLTNDSGFLTQHQSLSAYRTAAAQDAIDAGKLDKSGGTMTGDLTLASGKNIKWEALTQQNNVPTYVTTFYNNDASDGLSFTPIANLWTALLNENSGRLGTYIYYNCVDSCNDANQNGFYYVYPDDSARPSGVGDGSNNDYNLIAIVYNQNNGNVQWGYQIANDFRQNRQWRRNCNDSIWSAWEEIADVNDIPTTYTGW